MNYLLREIETIIEQVKEDMVRDRMDELKQENKKLREALEFYADYENYGCDDFSRTDGKDCFDIILHDFERNLNGAHYAGKKAREALKTDH